ncbi:hypothetical protein DMENIID0001_155280 [Sergentomyia squamirostris]
MSGVFALLPSTTHVRPSTLSHHHWHDHSVFLFNLVQSPRKPQGPMERGTHLPSLCTPLPNRICHLADGKSPRVTLSGVFSSVPQSRELLWVWIPSGQSGREVKSGRLTSRRPLPRTPRLSRGLQVRPGVRAPAGGRVRDALCSPSHQSDRCSLDMEQGRTHVQSLSLLITEQQSSLTPTHPLCFQWAEDAAGACWRQPPAVGGVGWMEILEISQ